MSKLQDVLDDKETEQEKAPDAQPEAEAAEEEAPETGDEDAEAPEAEAKDEVEKPKREPKSVPLAAFLEVQRKLEARLSEAEKRAADAEAKAKTAPDYSSFLKKPPEKIPSVYDDDAAFAQTLSEQQSAQIANLKFQISLDNAMQTFGQDRVNEAMGAFQRAAAQNPALAQAAEASLNPVREIVQWHETQNNLSLVEKIGGGQTLKKLFEAGGLEAYEKALRAQVEKELSSKFAKAADADEADEAPVKAKPVMPSNFNKGGKGGNKEVPPDTSLKSLLA